MFGFADRATVAHCYCGAIGKEFLQNFVAAMGLKR
jgi:hypothetical protein